MRILKDYHEYLSLADRALTESYDNFDVVLQYDTHATMSSNGELNWSDRFGDCWYRVESPYLSGTPKVSIRGRAGSAKAETIEEAVKLSRLSSETSVLVLNREGGVDRWRLHGVWYQLSDSDVGADNYTKLSVVPQGQAIEITRKIALRYALKVRIEGADLDWPEIWVQGKEGERLDIQEIWTMRGYLHAQTEDLE